MKTLHTATPWHIHKTSPENRIYIENSQGMLISEILQRQEMPDFSKERAAYIVKCVNSHEQLVEALKAAEEIINHRCTDRSTCNYCFERQCFIRDARILAEGVSNDEAILP